MPTHRVITTTIYRTPPQPQVWVLCPQQERHPTFIYPSLAPPIVQAPTAKHQPGTSPWRTTPMMFPRCVDIGSSQETTSPLHQHQASPMRRTCIRMSLASSPCLHMDRRQRLLASAAFMHTSSTVIPPPMRRGCSTYTLRPTFASSHWLARMSGFYRFRTLLRNRSTFATICVCTTSLLFDFGVGNTATPRQSFSAGDSTLPLCAITHPLYHHHVTSALALISRIRADLFYIFNIDTHFVLIRWTCLCTHRSYDALAATLPH